MHLCPMILPAGYGLIGGRSHVAVGLLLRLGPVSKDPVTRPTLGLAPWWCTGNVNPDNVTALDWFVFMGVLEFWLC